MTKRITRQSFNQGLSAARRALPSQCVSKTIAVAAACLVAASVAVAVWGVPLATTGFYISIAGGSTSALVFAGGVIKIFLFRHTRTTQALPPPKTSLPTNKLTLLVETWENLSEEERSGNLGDVRKIVDGDEQKRRKAFLVDHSRHDQLINRQAVSFRVNKNTPEIPGLKKPTKSFKKTLQKILPKQPNLPDEILKIVETVTDFQQTALELDKLITDEEVKEKIRREINTFRTYSYYSSILQHLGYDGQDNSIVEKANTILYLSAQTLFTDACAAYLPQFHAGNYMLAMDNKTRQSFNLSMADQKLYLDATIGFKVFLPSSNERIVGRFSLLVSVDLSTHNATYKASPFSKTPLNSLDFLPVYNTKDDDEEESDD